MTKRYEVYKCNICGNMVEILHEGKGVLVCCGAPMNLITENTVDATKEKHIPVVEKSSEQLKVSVGSIPHPMEDKHYIEWIEIISDGKISRMFLNPSQKPEAIFNTESTKSDTALVRAYCNLHGLWKA